MPDLAALRLAVAPYALAIKASLVVALLAGCYVAGCRHGADNLELAQDEVDSLTEQLRGEYVCREGSRCATQALDRAAAGAAAVADAREAAAEAARAELVALEANARAAVDRAAAAAARSQREAAAWRARYERAISTDERCRAWAEQPVSCPSS